MQLLCWLSNSDFWELWSYVQCLCKKAYVQLFSNSESLPTMLTKPEALGGIPQLDWPPSSCVSHQTWIPESCDHWSSVYAKEHKDQHCLIPNRYLCFHGIIEWCTRIVFFIENMYDIRPLALCNLDLKDAAGIITKHQTVEVELQLWFSLTVNWMALQWYCLWDTTCMKSWYQGQYNWWRHAYPNSASGSSGHLKGNTTVRISRSVLIEKLWVEKVSE